jgi:transketolase
VLSADLSKYTDVLPFVEKFPERFFQLGMAEANMMGVAGGLAKTGHLPIAVGPHPHRNARGVGFGRVPLVYLLPGDTVSVEIERVGTLTNPVVGPT